MSDPIPVTVIGGYLGAGKTTLVNHLLRTAGERVAVLVNDFGAINIDADLIERQDGETISLANGCICCSLVDGLAAALDTLNTVEPRPERLVIEASGVADPATVAAYGHGSGLTLDAVLVLADAETVRARANDAYVGDTVIGQLRAGDVLVLNKVDLVAAAEVAATASWLREMNPTAVVVEATQSRVAPALLFGLVDDRSPESGGDSTGARHDDAHQHGSELFESWSWTGNVALPRAAIERLMDEFPDSVVRAKGVLAIEDEPERAMILQRVGHRWSLRRSPAAPGQVTGSRLMVIGLRGAIDDAWLADRLGR